MWTHACARADAPLVVQIAVRDVQRAEERPDVRVGPIDDGVDPLKPRPVGVRGIPEAQVCCCEQDPE